MAQLGNTTVTGVTTQTVAAFQAQHLVRLGELQAMLAGYQQAGSGISTAQVAGLATFIEMTVQEVIENTQSITWVYNSGVPSLMASVALAPNGYLAVGSQGLYAQVGSGANQLMPGNAVPSGLPILPVTLHTGGTVSTGAFDGRQIPANFQGGTPIQDVTLEVIALTQGGILSTPSGVQADFGTAYTQVARGGDVQSLVNSVNALQQNQPRTISTASISLSLISSPGLPAGATFPVLFERAGEVLTGDTIGGRYEFDCAAQVQRVEVTALASSANTAFEMFVGGVATGLTVVVPSGVVGTPIHATFDPASPTVQMLLQPSNRTLPVTWQCISGSGSVVTAISQVDLVAYMMVLTQGTVGSRLSATLNIEPGGGLQTTASGVGVIYGDYVADYSPLDTVAPGLHTHQNLHAATSAYSTPSLTLAINAAQQLSGEVNIDSNPPAGYGTLAIDPNGLCVVLGTDSDVAAAGNHTHQPVSQSGSGFMTPAMLAQLNAGGSASGQVASYYRSSNCPVGAYVGGGLRWPQPMLVTGVNICAQTPPMFPQTFTLVVGGVIPTWPGIATSLSLTIPSGVSDVFAALDNIQGVFIPMESSSGVWTQYARWQCTSGTGTLTQMAAQITVNMNVIPA